MNTSRVTIYLCRQSCHYVYMWTYRGVGHQPRMPAKLNVSVQIDCTISTQTERFKLVVIVNDKMQRKKY